MSNKQPIKKRAAVEQMRNLSELNIPFSFGFFTCNTTKGTSQGYKEVQRAILRPGYRANQSDKAGVLIAYIDYDDTKEDKNRHFYYPLLMMFNGQKVQQ
jgi:hypothetical protein